VANHFSRLLRHAWVTVGLFLFPGHHTGTLKLTSSTNWTGTSDVRLNDGKVEGTVVPVLFLTEHHAIKVHWGMDV
jgi:hypothetical protein